MVILKPIDKNNYQEVLKLQVEDSQKSFVATNVHSLAQAYIYSDIAKPFAIYREDDEKIVGFCMLAVDPNFDQFGVWRLMIDRHYQGNGYGRAAMLWVIAHLQGLGANQINLSYEPENAVANGLYTHLGFVPTGEMDAGEVVMRLYLSTDSVPK